MNSERNRIEQLSANMLNVADVPSGVYFLRISALGVEEMRKVVIVH